MLPCRYKYEFINLFAPYVTRWLVDQALRARDPAAGVAATFGSVAAPK